jgi:hypothetical protein
VQFIFVGSNNITASQSINGASGTITFLGVTSASLVPADVIQSVTSANLSGTQHSWFARGDHQHAGVGPAGVSTGGNTAGSTGVLHGQLVFVGSNNITLSQSTDASNRMTISISGAAGAGNFSAGMSTGGNTSGDTGYASQRLNFAGSNNITLSGSTNGGSMSITISGPTGGGAGISTGGNTSGDTGTQGAQLVFVGGNNITLSGATAAGGSGTITISQKDPLVSKFYFEPAGAVSSSAQTQSSASFRYISIPYDISFSRIDVPILVASTSSATTNTCAWVISSGIVIYSVSASSTLNPIMGSFGTTTHTFASNTAGNQSLTGAKFASFALGGSLSAGHYYVGFQLSTANTSSVGASTTAIPFAVSMLFGSCYTAAGFNDFGSAAAASTDIMPMMGVMGTTITATNQTINMNTITATGVSKARANFPILFRAF